MKICPECESHFEGAKAFCPYDGTKLVESSERPTGSLVGETLGKAIKLEGVELADELGERYRARHTDEQESLRVTVFRPDALASSKRKARLTAAASRLPAELPPEVLGIRWMGLETSPHYLAERAPRGPSLRTLLDERGRLDWKTASRITCSIARALSFLADREVVHRGLHPHAVFVTDLEEGNVELGEWAHGLLTYRRQPLASVQESPGTFVGYAPYIPPESVRDGDDTDVRSLVYVLAMLLFEMLVGKPPFTSDKPADTLHRQLQEQPLKLSLAAERADFPSELEDILEMMWNKDPERRFQHPRAVLGALSSLLDADPETIAPPLTPREVDEQEDDEAADSEEVDDDAREPADASGEDEPGGSADAEASSDDDGDVDADTSMTMAGSPAVSVVGGVKVGEDAEPLVPQADLATNETQNADDAADEPAEPEASESPSSIVIDDEALEGADDEQDQQQAEVDEADDTDVETGESGTLLMGDVAADGGAPIADAPAQEAPTAQNEDIAKAPEDENRGADEHRDQESDEDADEAPQKTLLMGTVDDESSSPATDEEPVDREEPEDEKDKASEESEAEIPPRDDEPTEAADDEQAPDDDASPTDDKSDESLEVGFVEASVDGDDQFEDEWFGSETSDAWDGAGIAEEDDNWEIVRRHLTKGVFVLLALLAVGLFVFFETYEPAEEEGERAEAESDDDENELPGAEPDVDAFRADFDSALERGQLIRPRKNSALSYLEELERHAEDEEAFEKARETFIEAAVDKAEDVEDDDVGYARDLAGYASDFAPEDRELDEYTAKLHERATNGSSGDDEDRDDEDKEDEDRDDEDKDEDSRQARADSGGDGKGERGSDEPDDEEQRADSRSGTGGASASGGGDSDDGGPSTEDLLEDARKAQGAGKTERAIQLYKEVVDAESSNEEAHTALGDLLYDEARYNDALPHHRQAAKLAPRSVPHAVNLGRTYYKLERYEDAKNQWERALERDPDNRLAQRYMDLIEDKL